MFKRLISCAAALAMAFGAAAYLPDSFLSHGSIIVNASTTADDLFTSGDYDYKLLDDGTIEIRKYKGSASSVQIPYKLDRKSVAVISDTSFSGCNQLKEIKIPSCVRVISVLAFNNLPNLSKIEMYTNSNIISSNKYTSVGGILYNNDQTELIRYPEGLGDSYISNVSNATNYTAASKVNTIGNYAFSGCSKLSNIIIPYKTTKIGSYAFNGCTGLTNITISDSVETIGSFAFNACSGLTNITLPKSVRSFPSSAVANTNISFIAVDSVNSSYSSIDGVLYSKDKKQLLLCPPAKTRIIIPNSVKSIDSLAFGHCTHLESVTVAADNTAYSSGGGVLYNKDKTELICCPRTITRITILDSVTKICSYAFKNCSSITNVTIPDSVTIIGTSAFDGCSDNLIIKCNTDSYAHKFAKTNKIRFELLDHTHSYTSKITKAATCNAEGVKTFTCSCGDTYTETIPKTAHKYTEKVIAPTYEAQGYTLHTCSVCGNSYKDNYTDKLHKHSYTSKITKNETCAADGIRTYTCSCGDSYTETIPKLTTHTFGNWITSKAATCTTDGTQTRKCSVCGKTETKTIAKTGHKYTTKVVAPTTTAQGYTLYTCSVCGHSYTDNYSPLHTHSYTSKVTKAATCAATGVRTYTCSCGDSYTETIPKLTTHTFGNWSVTTNASCKAEGTETRKCSVCGKAETRAIAKTAHSYTSKVIAPTTSAQGYTLHTCSVCGASYKDNYTDKVHTHNYTSQVTRTATCAATGIRTYTCSCGDSYTETIPKLTTHTFGNWSVTTNASCKAEGTETRKCSVCSKTETRAIAKTAHSYTSKIVAPTTTAQGYTEHICSVCGTNYKDNYTDKLAVHTHSYTSKVTKSATCAATGIRTYTCSCGDSYTEIIPMAEHNYTAKTVAPTYTAQGYTQHTCSVCGDSFKDTYTAKLTPKTESISKATVTGISAKTYTGKAITQTPVVKLGTTTLKSGTDYTVAYKNNTKVGTATVTITGKGSYTGTVSKTFKINAASIAKATVSGLSNKTYTGKAITQNPTVKLGSTTLKKGTDYTVTFKNNKAVGKATVTIKGKGNYTGSISKTFKINPKKTTLKTATSPKTKQLKVTYSKVSGVTGYQTVYSTSSKFTKATTKTASSKNTSKTISGLTKGKTYYVKVRTYKTVKGTKYYSGYSAVKKIKIK